MSPAGTGTTLATYAAKITCDAGKGSASAGATSYDFAVAYGEKVNGTVTNTRNTGKLTVVKDFVGAPEGSKGDFADHERSDGGWVGQRG